MTDSSFSPLEAGCACDEVRFRLTRPPLFVHCCHCTRCQRETGAAFALNALIESEAVERVRGETETIDTPTRSGKGQKIVRCSRCRVALWSHYSAAGDTVCFVRVGTLDEPDRCPPDIHIFTSTKQRWLRLDGDTPVVPEYYRRSEHWPKDSIDRYKRALAVASR